MQNQIIRENILEVNFKDRIVVRQASDVIKINDEAWENSILPALDLKWHDPGKDEIDYIIVYNDNTYFFQKKRLKYDFQSQSSYWRTYTFADAKFEDVRDLADIFEAFFEAQKEEVKTEWQNEVLELFNYDQYYFSRWTEVRKKINIMLSFSDWRLLPDYQEEFSGEQKMWIQWRDKLRNLLPDAETFETSYDMFKYVSQMKYPIDPNAFIKMYPGGKDNNGNKIEYLNTENQYVLHDYLASKDYWNANLELISTYMMNIKNSHVTVREKTAAILDKLKAYDYFPELKKKIEEIDTEFPKNQNF